MKTISLNQANQDILKVIDYSLETHDKVSIASDNGAVVVLPQDDYEAMQETLRLLLDKKSLTALLHSHQLRDNGKTPSYKTIEDVFVDIQN